MRRAKKIKNKKKLDTSEKQKWWFHWRYSIELQLPLVYFFQILVIFAEIGNRWRSKSVLNDFFFFRICAKQRGTVSFWYEAGREVGGDFIQILAFNNFGDRVFIVFIFLVFGSHSVVIFGGERSYY